MGQTTEIRMGRRKNIRFKLSNVPTVVPEGLGCCAHTDPSLSRCLVSPVFFLGRLLLYTHADHFLGTFRLFCVFFFFFSRYLTYNLLEQNLPRKGEGRSRRARSAFIGAAASIVSAAASNAFRVLKVYR